MSVHDADIILYSMRVPSLKFLDLPDPKIRLIKALTGLVTLTSDLSTSKWGHRSPCHGFRPASVQLPVPFHSRLVCHVTDRQTAINA